MLRENIVKSQKDPNKLVGMEWCVGCLRIHLRWITGLQVLHCKSTCRLQVLPGGEVGCSCAGCTGLLGRAKATATTS